MIEKSYILYVSEYTFRDMWPNLVLEATIWMATHQRVPHNLNFWHVSDKEIARKVLPGWLYSIDKVPEPILHCVRGCPVRPSIFLFVCLSVYLSICLSVCQSVVFSEFSPAQCPCRYGGDYTDMHYSHVYIHTHEHICIYIYIYIYIYITVFSIWGI